MEQSIGVQYLLNGTIDRGPVVDGYKQSVAYQLPEISTKSGPQPPMVRELKHSQQLCEMAEPGSNVGCP